MRYVLEVQVPNVDLGKIEGMETYIVERANRQWYTIPFETRHEMVQGDRIRPVLDGPTYLIRHRTYDVRSKTMCLYGEDL